MAGNYGKVRLAWRFLAGLEAPEADGGRGSVRDDRERRSVCRMIHQEPVARGYRLGALDVALLGQFTRSALETLLELLDVGHGSAARVDLPERPGRRGSASRERKTEQCHGE